MTRREFTARSDAMSRRDGVYAGLWFALLFGVMFAGPWIDRLRGDGSAYGFLILIPLFACGGWMMWSRRHFANRIGLLCSHCGSVLDGLNGQHARITGNCRRCGKEVLSDTSAAASRPVADYKLTRNEFVSGIDAVARQTKRRQAVICLIGLGAAIACVPFAIHVNHLAELGDLGWVRTVAWVFAIILVTLVLALLSFFFSAARGKQTNPGVPCPECGRPIWGAGAQVALATGMCVYCGERIFDPAPVA